jgi:catechol 2,3-dioxygenase-like lactoylglutathione lyase family enzyme
MLLQRSFPALAGTLDMVGSAPNPRHTANFERIKTMAKLRHVAMQVPDLEKAAAFYEKCFELKRVTKAETEIGDALMLSDGVMNLTLLHFPKGTTGGINGPDWAGLHHIGFIVDDYDKTKEMIEEEGGKFFLKLPSLPGVDAENKFKDPNGVVFDVSEHDWRQARD